MDIHFQRRKRKTRIAEIPFFVIGIICAIGAPLIGSLFIVTLYETYKLAIMSAIVMGAICGFAIAALAVLAFRRIVKMEKEISAFEEIVREQRKANGILSS